CVFSVPPVASWPNGCRMAFGAGSERMDYGLKASILPFVNLPGLKQVTIFFSTFVAVLSWSIRNRKSDRYVMTYSDYPPYCMPAYWSARLTGAKTVLLLADMPCYVHYHPDDRSLRGRAIAFMEELKERMHGWYDMYILLTEPMVDRIGCRKQPWIVVEGFSDASMFDGIPNVERSGPRAVMYAGSLGKGYNIPSLIEAFGHLEADCEFWVFGDGDCTPLVRDAAARDARVRYMGKVPRAELLAAMKRARLLISVKDTRDEYTRYAFPAKILEYMTSGTPVLTTKVGGIPDEYFAHVFAVEDESPEGIAKAIGRCLAMSDAELDRVGVHAQAFVMNQKNYAAQGLRIWRFLEEDRCQVVCEGV
ncbi:MAG: glycosyltransferase, partial [Bacillota bacterium]|nr:glycosyltransferase [Bacillota bacterium]